MATQAAAAYAAQQQLNSAAPQAKEGEDGAQEDKPATWKEWLLRVGAVGNCKFNTELLLSIMRGSVSLCVSLCVSLVINTCCFS